MSNATATGGTPMVVIDGANHGRVGEDVGDLLVAIASVESRAIRLVREGSRMPVEAVVEEFAGLAHELRRCFGRLVDLTERRDLSFVTQQKLRRLKDQCIWLYRKTRREQAFFKKLALEAQLRGLISEDAFRVYQRLLCVEDEDRRLAARDDAALAAFLLSDVEETGLP